MKEQVLFCALAFFLLSLSSVLKAQDHLDVDFKDAASVPDFLNVCGDSDNEVVVVRINGTNPDIRSNIQATAHLFPGVRLIEFDSTASSPGVSLLDQTDPNNPIFSLPDLDPVGLTEVEIAFRLAADCAFTDTLSANGALTVQDVWEFDYLLDTIPLNESDINSEYRDAFAVPFFTVSVSNSVPYSKVGDCQSRQIEVINSGLDGFVDTLMYENYQGAGIHITGLLANGIPVPIVKTATPGGDTLVTAVLDSTYFRLNTIGGLPGNGNAFMDPNESIILTESYCVMSCDEDRSSSHEFSWGCYGRYCNTVTESDFVVIGQGDPLPQIVISALNPSSDGGYCQTGTSSLTFSNAGAEVNPGFGTMYNVAVGVGLGGSITLYHDGMQITSLTIAGISISPVTTLSSLDNHPSFMVDPDGAGGLEDLDGDGFYDDLAIGEEVEVQVSYEFDCSMAQESTSECANELSVPFSARIDYDDYCLDRYTEVETSYYSVTNTRDSETYDSDVDAFLQTDIFFIRAQLTRNIRNFARNCGGNEEFRVQVVLPPNINPEIGQIELIRNTTNSLPILADSIQNDTLFLSFDASATAFLGGEYEIVLAFRGDCIAALGPTIFPTTLSFYCPTCDCEHLWFCNDLSGPVLHRANPPCSPQVCPLGVQTLDFEVNRTTFGFTDNSYTTPYDPNLANKKVALSCDSVEMVVSSIVGSTPITDSIAVEIVYDAPNDNLSPGAIFHFSDADIRFVSGGTTYNCTIDPSVYTFSEVGGSKMMHFDLDACLTGLGITLSPGDSIVFEGRFALNPDGPFETNFYELPNFRGQMLATMEGSDYSCDNFGERFTVSKTQNIFAFPSSSSYPDGCEETYLEYRLITRNNGFATYFGNETRASFAVDSITIDFDPNILQGFALVEPQVSIPGHPVHGNAFFDVPGFELFPSGQYIARFDTLMHVPSLNSIASYGFNFRVRLVPNCQSPFGSVNGDNFYNFDLELFFKDRYYASTIGDGSCVLQQTDTLDSEIEYEELPTFNFVPLSNPTAELFTDTAYWTVQVCNTSFFSDAGGSWIALEDPDSAIQLVGVTFLDDPGNPIELSVNPYGATGSNGFAVSEGLLRAGGGNSQAQRCNTYRLKAVVNECGVNDAVARFGWNCVAYTDSTFTPAVYPPCNPSQLALQVDTYEPFLDANVIAQPSAPILLCDTVTVDILLRNTDLGSLYDLRSRFTLPAEGATLLSGSSAYAYPSSAAFQSMAVDPVLVETTLQGDVYEYADLSATNSFLDDEGIRGFDPVSPTDSNEIVFRFQYVLDCAFMGGSLAHYEFQGFKGCGDTTNIELGETLPILVDDGGASAGHAFDISVLNNTFLANATNDITIEVVNTGSDSTSVEDLIRLRIADTLTYVPGSTQGLQPGSWMPSEPNMELDAGFQTLRWNMPVGLAPGDTAQLTFQLDLPGLACADGAVALELYNVFQTNISCDTISCSIENITSSNTGQLTPIPSNVDGVFLDVLSIDGNCNGTTEEGMVNGQVINQGFDFMGNPFTLNYYFDANANGLVDLGEPLVDAFAGNGPLAIGDTLPFTHVISPGTSQWCLLILQVDTTGLNICGQPSTLLQSPPALQNAGSDILFCADQSGNQAFTLGDSTCNAIAGYTYNWTAIPPASATDLSSTTILNPTLTLSHTGSQEDSLSYVLETVRPGCGVSTFDTVTIIRSETPLVDVGPDLYLEAGQSMPLNPSITGGAAPLTYQWSPAAGLSDSTIANPIVSQTSDTAYILTVTSATGCTGVDTLQIFIGAPFNAEVNVSDTIICEGSDLSLLATGGDGYLWQADPANLGNGILSDTTINNPLFSGGLAGEVYVYEVVVTDSAYPFVADTAQVRIEIAANPVLLTSFPDTNNCESSLIYVQMDVSNPVVTYEITTDGVYNNDQMITSNTLEFTIRADIAPAVFDIYFTDVNGCTLRDSILLEPCIDPTGLCDSTIVSNLITTASLCGQTTGIAEIQLSQPLANYSFNWSPDVGVANAEGNRRTELPAGVYSVDVVLNSDPTCFANQVFVIGNADGPQAAVSSTTPATCEGNNGAITLSPVNLNYQWSDGGSGAVRLNMGAGLYTVTVTDPIRPSCPNYLLVTLDSSNPLSASYVVDQRPTCGMMDGTATVTANGGSGSYVYVWPDGSVTPTNANLGSGSHTVTVLDTGGSGCRTEVVVFVADDVNGASLITITPSPVTCGGGGDGSIEYFVTYTGAFVSPSDTIITDGNSEYQNGQLPAGQYCLYLLDDNGCIAAGDCFEILEAEPLDIQINALPDCGSGGSISVMASGQDSITFDWSDLPGTSNPANRSDLSNGTYSLTVTDANACSAAVEVVISNAQCPCTLPVVEFTGIYEANCGEDNGGVALYLEGDESAYYYNWMPNIGTPNAVGNERGDLPAGVYQVLITDTLSSMCEMTVTVVLPDTDSPQVDNITTTDANCMTGGTAMLSPDTLSYSWSDGGSGANRTGLAPGIYPVTVEDPAQPACQNYINVVIGLINDLSATVTIDSQPLCGIIDYGSATINVSGGSGNYTYSWSSGTATNDSLLAGTYFVTVTDEAAGGCPLEVPVLMLHDGGTLDVTITDTTHLNCFGETTGSVDFIVDFGANPSVGYDTLITNVNGSAVNGQLIAGTYCLTVSDPTGCLQGGACFSIDEPDALQATVLVEQDCANGSYVEIFTDGGRVPYLIDWADLPGTNDPVTRTIDAQGIYPLTITDANGCAISENALILPSCISDSCEYFGGDTLVYLQAVCGFDASLCIDVPFSQQANFNIRVNGSSYTGPINSCAPDSLVVYSYQGLFGQGNQGPYEVTSWEVGGMLFTGVFQDIPALVDSMNTWDVNGNWVLDTMAQTLSGGVSGVNYSVMEVNAINFSISSTLNASVVVSPSGFSIQLPQGTNEIILNSLVDGCADTITAEVYCTTTDTIFEEVLINESDTLCLDVTELPGTIDTIFNACPGAVGNVDISFLPDSTCVILEGVTVGLDTACIVICDDLGICDTTTVVIDVTEPDGGGLIQVVDTILVDEEVRYCLDTTQLTISSVDTMYNACLGASGDEVVFELDPDSLCITYTGIAEGVDSACIVLCDAMNQCDTLSLTVVVLPEDDGIFGPDYVVDTIYINQTEIYCVDTTELSGTIISIENVCPDVSSGDVDFDLDPFSFCVSYTGDSLGLDTACIVICDDLGNCDTTYFTIYVQEFFDFPNLNDDYDTTAIGTPVVIDIKTNDNIFGGIVNAFILDAPAYGTATINLDCSATYVPGVDFCEREDQFTYVACNPVGCDTATVYVYILCIDVVVFNAVSANEDGVNDTFFISGLDKFPDNQLRIYNRWGNLVYNTQGYLNDWKGIYNDVALPDGTYFYILELNDEEGRVFNGYLELYR